MLVPVTDPAALPGALRLNLAGLQLSPDFCAGSCPEGAWPWAPDVAHNIIDLMIVQSLLLLMLVHVVGLQVPEVTVMAKCAIFNLVSQACTHWSLSKQDHASGAQASAAKEVCIARIERLFRIW